VLFLLTMVSCVFIGSYFETIFTVIPVLDICKIF